MSFGDILGGLGGLASGAASLLSKRGGGHSPMYYWDRMEPRRRQGVEWDLLNQPRLRVEGAKAAGLHPLVAMGMPVASNQLAGSFGDTRQSGGTDLSWLQDVGQDIGRAVDSLMSRDEVKEQKAYDRESATLQLEKQRAEIDNIKASTAATIARSTGQQNIMLSPQSRVGMQPVSAGIPGPSSGSSTGADGTPKSSPSLYTWTKLPDGGLMRVLNPDLADSITESFLENWNANRIKFAGAHGGHTPPYPGWRMLNGAFYPPDHPILRSGKKSGSRVVDFARTLWEYSKEPFWGLFR